ncbi:unnamed protein product [Caenorhabditis auriculariae]|uniref:Aldehyde dehydrogenase domain-containing protein n=1 Tax=Caenorhabditis auriculariae TaxID=2777116 RepID=A0A8S1HW93_9PELO|nr:unnamed protein product [Caenorhabditis auriculariae]
MEFAEPGDLVFFEKRVSKEFVDAVAASGNSNLVHVGIISSRGTLVHATPDGVLEQKLEETAEETENAVLEVVRVDLDRKEKMLAEEIARSKVGLPYNDVFSANCKNSKNEEAYYCSQIVTEAYQHADMRWPSHQLNFQNEDGSFIEYWVQYYKERGVQIPQGDPGSHPAQLRKSPLLQSVMTFAKKPFGAFLGDGILEFGHWVNGKPSNFASSHTFPVIEPRSGKTLATWNAATPEQVKNVVDIAKKAQTGWGKTTWLERSEVLRKTAELLRSNCEEIAKWECLDNGKPIYEARADVLSCVDTFIFYSGVAHGLLGHHIPLDGPRFAYTKRLPMGVVACIGAWNYPIQTCTWKTAPALACGNAVVYKPSPLCPVSALILGQILKSAGLPDGVFSVVQGDADVARALIENENVSKVSFTGSIPTGKKIMQACAGRNIKPVTMELGGKSSLIIFEDADIDSAVACAMMANFFSQGQVCSNASKVLVHKSVLEEFSKRLLEKTKNLKVGDPMDESTRVGAHVSAAHRDKVESYIQGAISQKARVLYGGERVKVPGLEDGFYLSPCILTDIRKDMTVYNEEIFGSVLLLIPFETEEEALEMANDTKMGLAAGFVTRDLSRAHRVADCLHAGNVYVNTFNDVSSLVPFGGFGESGFGRENGLAVLEHYTQLKSVFVNPSTCENPF